VPTEWTVRAITRAMLPVLLVLTLVELGSGLVLGSFEAQLFRYPSLLVLVPVTIGTAGNLGSVLAARLSTSFHLGTLSFSPRDDELAGNAVATLALAVTVFPVIGAGAWVATLLAIGAPLGAIGRWLLVGDLLAGLLAVLASVGGIALLVGFAFAQEAAAIRRFDHALADAAEAALASNGAGSGSTAGADREERPVLVVPARHAAGVAAILRERDVDATAQRVEIGDSPASVS